MHLKTNASDLSDVSKVGTYYQFLILKMMTLGHKEFEVLTQPKFSQRWNKKYRTV